MSEFIWETKTDERLTEKVSQDGRWHLSTKTGTGKKPQMYLINYDLLCSPCGLAENLPNCLLQFIQSCDRQAEKIAIIKAEAKRLLADCQVD
jgi:hypothetical protein